MSESESDEGAARSNEGNITQIVDKNYEIQINSSCSSLLQSGECESYKSELDRLDEACTSLSVLDSQVPEIVTYEIGGRLFSFHRSSIERDPQSLLFVLANKHFSLCENELNLPASKRIKVEPKNMVVEGCTGSSLDVIRIPEKNADVFHKLANIIRGYRSPIPSDWIDTCEKEAAFYGLQTSWKRNQHFSKKLTRVLKEVKGTSMWSLFTFVGESIAEGNDEVDLALNGNNVGVGVLGRTKDAETHHFGMFFCSDGKIRTCSDSEGYQQLSSAPKWIDNSIDFRISFDVESSIVQWDYLTWKGTRSAVMERVPSNLVYQFAVLAFNISPVSLLS